MPSLRNLRLVVNLSVISLLISASVVAIGQEREHRGFYRYPAIHGDTVVFTSEGDLWSVPVQGGAARRLTSDPGEESMATISPDGQTVAFAAQYEGPTEVYTLSLATPAPPLRQTWEGANATVIGWTPQGEILYSTRRYSTPPRGTRPRATQPRRTRSRTRP